MKNYFHHSYNYFRHSLNYFHHGNQNETLSTTDEDDLEKRSFEITAVHSSEDMNLKEELLRGILGYGFEKPTLIQQLATIPCMRGGRDFIVRACPRTGKTAMFSISVLQQIDSTISDCQALIVADPKHADKTFWMIAALGAFLDLKFYSCISRTDVRQDLCEYKEIGGQIIVCTTESVRYMIELRCIKLDTIKVFVLDDAEKLIYGSDEHRKRVYEFCKHLPKNVQIILGSTWMTKNVLQFSKEFMKDPVNIAVVN